MTRPHFCGVIQKHHSIFICQPGTIVPAVQTLLRLSHPAEQMVTIIASKRHFFTRQQYNTLPLKCRYAQMQNAA